MVTNPDGWSVAGATALGGRHFQSGLPNQDAYGSRWVTHNGNEVLLIAVADGHGGARYVRSDVGSSLAVEVAIAVAADAVANGILRHSIGRRERVARADLASQVVQIWRDRCLQHVDENPFTREEATRAAANLEDDPVLSYGSTLLLAVLSPDQHLLVQLGDGDCLVTTSDGSTRRPIPGDERLTGGETTSLCLPDAEYDFRVAALDDPDIELVVLASDGYGVAFAADDWRDVVSSDMLRQFRQRGAGYVANELPAWLEDSARVGGDDVTVMVAHRPLQTEAVAATESPSRSLAWMLAGLVVALAIGASAGWWAATVVASPDESPAAAATTSTSLSTTTSRPTGTTTTMPTATTELIEPGTATTAAGSDVAGSTNLSSEWVVSGDGTVVEFVPDPANPQPEIAAANFQVSPTGGTLAWGSYWAVENGVLLSDGAEIGLTFDLEPTLEGIVFANDHLWILTRGASWLLSLNEDRGCTPHPVARSVLSTEQGPLELPSECVLDPSGGSVGDL